MPSGRGLLVAFRPTHHIKARQWGATVVIRSALSSAALLTPTVVVLYYCYTGCIALWQIRWCNGTAAAAAHAGPARTLPRCRRVARQRPWWIGEPNMAPP